MAGITSVYVAGKSLREIAEENGLPVKLVRDRWERGARSYERLAKPYGELLHIPKIVVEGVSLKEISKNTGISYNTIWRRWSRGKRNLKELTKPVRRG